MARIIQAKLIENTGWQVVVDNKPGGMLVGASVAMIAPDRQTWMVTFDDILNPAFAPSSPTKFELLNVMLIGRTPQAIARTPALQDLRQGRGRRQGPAGKGELWLAGAAGRWCWPP